MLVKPVAGATSWEKAYQMLVSVDPETKEKKKGDAVL